MRRRGVGQRRAPEQPAADAAVALGPHDGAQAGHVRVAPHVRTVLVEPAGHEQRLRAGRVEPGLQDEAVARGRAQVVGDLQAALGVQFLFEVARQR